MMCVYYCIPRSQYLLFSCNLFSHLHCVCERKISYYFNQATDITLAEKLLFPQNQALGMKLSCFERQVSAEKGRSIPQNEKSKPLPYKLL